eukprot:COSAG02_NODE_3197_length_7187_cov_2.437923_5_plen_97_part_00
MKPSAAKRISKLTPKETRQTNDTTRKDPMLNAAYMRDERTSVYFTRWRKNNDLLTLADAQARLTRILTLHWPGRRRNAKLRLNPGKKVGHDSLAWA